MFTIVDRYLNLTIFSDPLHNLRELTLSFLQSERGLDQVLRSRFLHDLVEEPHPADVERREIVDQHLHYDALVYDLFTFAFLQNEIEEGVHLDVVGVKFFLDYRLKLVEIFCHN